MGSRLSMLEVAMPDYEVDGGFVLGRGLMRDVASGDSTCCNRA